MRAAHVQCSRHSKTRPFNKTRSWYPLAWCTHLASTLSFRGYTLPNTLLPETKVAVWVATPKAAKATDALANVAGGAEGRAQIAKRCALVLGTLNLGTPGGWHGWNPQLGPVRSRPLHISHTAAPTATQSSVTPVYKKYAPNDEPTTDL